MRSRSSVEAVNARFARIEQVKRFAILDHDLSQAAGELTPTLKLKRTVVYERYTDDFAELYEAPERRVPRFQSAAASRRPSPRSGCSVARTCCQ